MGSFLLSLIFLLLFEIQAEIYNFKIIYEWKQVEYKFRSEEERTEAIANGTFDLGNVPAIDIEYTFNNCTDQERIFITTPRMGAKGTPATLSIITNETRDGNPIVDPYPSWSWHLNPDLCNFHRIVSVFRTWLDECNRLWVIDTGLVGSVFVCPPQIMAFDLETDNLLHKYEVPYDQYQNISWYIAPVAEVENSCENTFIYIGDPYGPSLLVYSLHLNDSWRIQDQSFENDPNYMTYKIAGDVMNATDGLFTIAITPKTDSIYGRILRYHGLSTIKESWVYTNYLKNPINFLVPYGSSHIFNTYNTTRNQQASVEVIDKHGNVYFPLLITVEIAKWDPRKPYDVDNFEIIANDKEAMQFPTGLKIGFYKGGPRYVLWVFATSEQRYEANKLNGNITNLRLFMTELYL